MIIKEIRISSPEANLYAGLTDKQLRADGGLFIAESANVIAAAAEAGLEPISFLSQKRHIPALEARFGESFPEAPILTADDAEIEKLTGYRLHRGVLAAFRRAPSVSPEEASANASRAVVLENVTDPTNVGAIFRSAAALGMDAVLLSGSSCDPLHRRALRVSMGAVFRIPWAFVPARPDLKNAVDVGYIRRLGFETAALALRDSSVSVTDPALKREKRLAVILGAEGEGLSPVTVSECGYTVRIPMHNGMDSLNVAAAAAVAFWELSERLFEKSQLGNTESTECS